MGHRHGSPDTVADGHILDGRDHRARARIEDEDGTTTEWKSKELRAYPKPHARRRCVDHVVLSCAGTSTRRVRRALKALFAERVSKVVVSRVWRKVKNDWETWHAPTLATEPIVRLILDGTVVRVRLDK